jgi:DNA-binding CsgD family transcriptional regulator
MRTGIVLVAADGRVVHANRAAEEMLKRGQPVALQVGRLGTGDAASRAELEAAISLCGEDETRIARSTIGLRVGGDDGPAAFLHILPLARGTLRPGLMPAAVAAVLIARGAASPEDIAAALANGFGLTASERRVLELLLGRCGVAEAAAELGVSPNTIKTHVARIFEKTGVSSQADLVRLGSDLVPPLATTPSGG